jgi:non-specific serine/threonine protein kinase/serine/threonine-protein kinase
MSDKWQRAKDVFDEALRKEQPLREAFVEAVCASDDELRREVQALLEADAHETGVLDEPPLPRPEPSAAEQIRGDIGPYRLQECVGRGGMGVVYRAVRVEGAVQQVVAIKVLNLGAATDEAIARFHLERRTLSALDHPHIARQLDGGTTVDGLPYLVMEYVDGQPVDRYCDQHRLGLDRRLTLFRQICGAVHYSHQHLIVHRDIKPDNILVTREGVVKLLDFGVAKLLADADDEGLSSAHASTRLLTPGFASPEQVTGQPITTAADVFSLGAVLYGLLTGRRAFTFTGAGLAEIERVVCQTEPVAPSVVVEQPPHAVKGAGGEPATAAALAERRGESLRTLRRKLSGDLDMIVAMALRKEPTRRYATVAQLAEDVRRFQRGLPVMARRDTFVYRTAKFLRRHAVELATVSTFLLAVMVTSFGAISQAQAVARERERAERRTGDLRELTSLLFSLHDSIADVPGTTQARALMVNQAVVYLDRLAQESSPDPSLQRELAEAYVKVGDVLGNPTSANVGDISGALESYEKSVSMAETMLAANRHDAEAQTIAAMAHRKLGDVTAWSGNVAAAVEHARLSLAEFGRLLEDHPSDEHRFDLAVAHIKLADLLGNDNFPNLGDSAGADTHYADALGLLAPLVDAVPSNDVYRRYLALTRERQGQMHEQAGRLDQALVEYRASFAAREELAGRNPHHAEMSRDLAIAHEKIANVLTAQGQHRQGLESHRRSFGMLRTLYERDQSNVNAARSLGISCEKLAAVLLRNGDRREARALLERALELYDEVIARDEANAMLRADRARVTDQLARLTR